MTCYWESEYREIAGRVWKSGWFTCCTNPRRERNQDFRFYMCRILKMQIQSKEECWDYLEEYIDIGGLFGD